LLEWRIVGDRWNDRRAVWQPTKIDNSGDVTTISIEFKFYQII
jgi:hypothetical protein